MYKLTLGEIAVLGQGKLLGPQSSENIRPCGASIDTRTIKPGELFFALHGERVDGHDYLAAAREKGAVGAVVSYCPEGFEPGEFPLIQVKDVLKALQLAALAMRRKFSGPVIAITGSTGKTTTKDMLWSILQETGPVLKNQGNRNNELGLPLTLLALEEQHRAIVLEMGMRALGEIDFLARLSEPNYGIITNVGQTHLELLGSQQKIAQAKAELLSHIPCHGGMSLNIKDRVLLKPWLSNLRSQLCWIGLDPTADLWARDIKETRTSDAKTGLAFTVFTDKGQEQVIRLNLPGRHNVTNALLAISAARQLGIPWEKIAAGLKKVRLTSMRLEFQELKDRNILLINDAYNANPDSMQAALEVLRSQTGRGRRGIAVLGSMYELGAYQEEGHLLVGKKTKEADPAYLITVGELARLIAEGACKAGMSEQSIRTCRNNQEALAHLKEIMQPGDVVLVKGSRGVKMEEIVAGLF